MTLTIWVIGWLLTVLAMAKHTAKKFDDMDDQFMAVTALLIVNFAIWPVLAMAVIMMWAMQYIDSK